MTYAVEFPAFAADVHCAQMAARADAWEDTSWRNDACPSFTCDVFVLYIDAENRWDREFPQCARFVMKCEDEVYLETENWSDVLAFMDEGERFFPEYVSPPMIDILTAEFAAWLQAQSQPMPEGDATELLLWEGTTPAQREWLHAFAARWDEEAAADPMFYDKQAVVEG